jgi:hypothetical protein
MWSLRCYWWKDWKGYCENFYYSKGNPKYNTMMSIIRWVKSKTIASSINNNASSINNNNTNSINNNAK